MVFYFQKKYHRPILHSPLGDLHDRQCLLDSNYPGKFFEPICLSIMVFDGSHHRLSFVALQVIFKSVPCSWSRFGGVLFIHVFYVFKRIMQNKILFLPGLNGIRSLAAIGVMISHTALAFKNVPSNYHLFGMKNGMPNSWVLGEHGVTMFFVLSGFLITFLLLNEKQKTNKIHIKSFYRRRILRIWPLYYLYFIIVFCLFYLVGKPFNFKTSSPYFYLFFLANIPFIFEMTLPLLDHFWSIGVEEQFYLFWPWLFRIKDDILMKIGIFIVVFLSILRVLLWYYIPFSEPALFSVVNRFDCMVFGGLGAIFYFKKNKIFLKFVDNKITQFFALAILVSMIINIFSLINSILEIFVVELVTLIIIVGQINVKNRILNFNNKVMDYLGKLSYGIYVIHVIILYFVFKFFHWSFITNELLRIFCIYLTVIIFTIITAHFSYNYFEKYFLKLKNKFAIIKSSSSNTFDTYKN